MAMAVGVLCARVRVEEKQIITALGDAGAVAMPMPPTSLPLPPCPAAQDVAVLGGSIGADETGFPDVIIDRSTNRQAARPMNRLLEQAGVRVVDAGLASRRNRQEVATAWANAGLPRPKTLVAFSEASGVEAANMVGYPSTLLPLVPGSSTTVMLDEDTADAVIEHRVVLGTDDDAIVMVQAGAPEQFVRVHVVGGTAVAFDGDAASDAAIDLAQRAARVIEAAVVAIDVAMVGGSLVVWDAMPVVDFRKSTLLGDTTVADAIAELANAYLHAPRLGRGEEARSVFALSA